MDKGKGYLRDAKNSDVDMLFDWANEASVRKNSFSTKPISYEEHVEWFQQLSKSSDCKQYIYMYEDEAIGQARISIYGDMAEIGYSICAEKRCKGHGSILLKLIRRQIRSDFPEIKKLIGKVKPDNIASQKAFLDAGYIEKYYMFELSIEDAKHIKL